MKTIKKILAFLGRMFNYARQRKPFRVFLRQLFNASVVAIAGYEAIIAGLLPVEFAFVVPIVFALFNQFVKRVNVRYWKDLGVDNKTK